MLTCLSHNAKGSETLWWKGPLTHISFIFNEFLTRPKIICLHTSSDRGDLQGPSTVGVLPEQHDSSGSSQNRTCSWQAYSHSCTLLTDVPWKRGVFLLNIRTKSEQMKSSSWLQPFNPQQTKVDSGKHMRCVRSRVNNKASKNRIVVWDECLCLGHGH